MYAHVYRLQNIFHAVYRVRLNLFVDFKMAATMRIRMHMFVFFKDYHMVSTIYHVYAILRIVCRLQNGCRTLQMHMFVDQLFERFCIPFTCIILSCAPPSLQPLPLPISHLSLSNLLPPFPPHYLPPPTFLFHTPPTCPFSPPTSFYLQPPSTFHLSPLSSSFHLPPPIPPTPISHLLP